MSKHLWCPDTDTDTDTTRTRIRKYDKIEKDASLPQIWNQSRASTVSSCTCRRAHRVWSIEKFPTPRRAGVHRASASVSASGAGSISKTPCRSITNTNATWPVLQILDLAINHFSGKLPQTLFKRWEAMMSAKSNVEN